MKNMKRFGAILLALVMVLGINSTAWAVNTDSTDKINEWRGIEANDNMIGIAKQIVFVNAEDTTVREPNIVYTYTISSATPGSATVKDHIGISGTVKAGPIDAVTGTVLNTKTSQITFADTSTSSATITGEANTKYATFTFDPTKLTAPGIYRYQIVESCEPAKASVGVTSDADYNPNRFLDVYVKWNDARTALEIYGYVLFEDEENDQEKSITSTDVAMKSQGYVNTATSGQSDVDVYTTENLVISKVTTGSLADLNNDFPVTITMTKASGLTNGIKLDFKVANNGALTKVGTDTVGDYVTMDTPLSGTVRNSSTISIIGIPAGSSVTMTEKNNTSDSYKVKAGKTTGADDLLTESIVAAGATSGSTSPLPLTAKAEIYFTNTLDTISPTGLVMRFAPYALILAAGIVLLVVAMKHKSRKDDDED